jgi:hypothetical protein
MQQGPAAIRSRRAGSGQGNHGWGIPETRGAALLCHDIDHIERKFAGIRDRFSVGDHLTAAQ